MFMGTYFVTMDAKGRVNMPAKFREVLNTKYSAELIITNLENYLVAYPRNEWLQLVDKIRNFQSLDRDGRSLLKIFFARATNASLDGQGRTLIDPQLRQFAGLEREIVLVGFINRIEVWSRERWNSFVQDHQERYTEMADTLLAQSGLSELGL